MIGVLVRQPRRALNKAVLGLAAHGPGRGMRRAGAREGGYWREALSRMVTGRLGGLVEAPAGAWWRRRSRPTSAFQAVWAARTQTPAVRVRPRPTRLRRLSPAVRRVSQALFFSVPR